jgi:hypothetical protein
MADHFSKEQKIDMLEQFLFNKKSIVETCRSLRSIWGQGCPVKIDHQNFKTIYENFKTFGSVFHPRSRTPTVRTPANIENVKQIAKAHAVAGRNSGSQQIALQAGISQTSAWRILTKDLKLKPYHLKLVHKLNEEDFDRRVQFSEIFLELDQVDPRWKDSILWSDEAIFSLSETVNRHNCVYWDESNPNRSIDVDNLGSEQIMIWAGISSNHKIGPFFFETSVNATSYLEMLTEQVMPVVSRWEDFDHLTWQQDGAPSHYAHNVRNFLNETFSDWIGRRGTIEWPA